MQSKAKETRDMEELQSCDIVLPHDLIVQHILTRLPIKSLLNFKCVSKQWHSSISSPHFTLTLFKSSTLSTTHFLFIQNNNNYYLFSLNHDDDTAYRYPSTKWQDSDLFCYADNAHQKIVNLDQKAYFRKHIPAHTDSPLDLCMGGKSRENLAASLPEKIVKLRSDFVDDGVVLIGSCNGLVCLGSFNGDYFILWNPFSGMFQKYVDLDVGFSSCSGFRVSWGFGYVSFDDDFKVVRIVEWPGSNEICVHVISLKSNQWRRICDEVCENVFKLRTRKVEVDDGEGVLRISYLFHSRQGVLCGETLCWIVSDVDGCGRKIVAFDLMLETFEMVDDLELVSNEVFRDKFLCVVGGCLSKCGVNLRDDVEIRVLKGPREVEVIRISRDLRLRSCQSIVGFTGMSEIYVLLEGSTIGVIDPKSQPVNYKPLLTFETLGKTRVSSFVPSLFAPNAVET